MKKVCLDGFAAKAAREQFGLELIEHVINVL
jgi:hypothetical protein